MNFAARNRLELAASRNHSLGMIGVYDLMRERFMELALGKAYTATASDWTITEDAAEVVETLLAGFSVNRARRREYRSWYAVDEGEATGVWVELHGDGDWSAIVTGSDQDTVDNLLGRFEAALPPADRIDGNVFVTFHCLGPLGPISYTRQLAAGQWAETQVNYPQEVRDRLEVLMTMDPPDTGGRLVLMHGPPGTGKSHCVRALAHAWGEWADVDYVVDPDAFFEYAHYMISTVVMGGGTTSADRWHVVVLEDSGQFLKPVTENTTPGVSAGLGRLLNLADGLVGQGLNLILLMSTNEPIGTLAPALTRPGRCMASIEFPAFTVEEANGWLADRRSRQRVDGEATLAELYQLTRS